MQDTLKKIEQLLDQIATDLAAYRERFFNPWGGTSKTNTQLATLRSGPPDSPNGSPSLLIQKASAQELSNHQLIEKRPAEARLHAQAAELVALFNTIPGLGHERLSVAVKPYTPMRHNRLSLEIDGISVPDSILALPNLMKALVKPVDRLARMPHEPYHPYLVGKTTIHAPDAKWAVYKFGCLCDPRLLERSPPTLPMVSRIIDGDALRYELLALTSNA